MLIIPVTILLIFLILYSEFGSFKWPLLILVNVILAPIGGLLALYTLRRSLGTVVLLGGAGALLYRGLKGQCALYQAMGVSTVAHDPQSVSPHSVAAPEEQSRIVLAGS